MHRLRRFILVAAVATVSIAGLAFPKAAFACSCAGEPKLSDAAEGDVAVFVGRVASVRADGSYDFAVERWFRGGSAAVVPVMSARQVFPDGMTALNTCGLDLQTGQHLLLAAGRDEAGVYYPNICSYHAEFNGEFGGQLAIEANQLFGPGFVPGTAPPEPGAGLTRFVLPALAGLAFVTIVLFAFVRRERPHPGGPS